MVVCLNGSRIERHNHIINFPIPIPSHIITIHTKTNATFDCIIMSILDLGLDWEERLPPAEVTVLVISASVLLFARTPFVDDWLKIKYNIH